MGCKHKRVTRGYPSHPLQTQLTLMAVILAAHMKNALMSCVHQLPL